MQDAVQKADILIEALPYMQSFQDKAVVIKLGGSGMDNEETLKSVLKDIVFMRVVGMHPVVVHGGGPYITRAMASSGLKPVFIQGHRVTDLPTLAIVEQVLLRDVNWMIVRKFRDMGGKAAPLHVRLVPFLRAVRKQVVPDGGGAPIDLGLVGSIKEVEPEFIEELCQVGRIPVIAPMALSPDGELLNVNADTAAAKIAVALRAEKLIFFTNVPGVMRDPEDPSSLFSTLHEADVHALVKEEVIRGGMLPKVQACLAAVHDGVHKAHIVDMRIPHSLLLEMFTDRGIGTEILR
jgi:acetylglutamate kinase